jgi:hypothetical protein
VPPPRPLPQCSDCAAGTYSDVPGAASCRDCPAGKHSTTSAALACSDCSPGTYSIDGASTCTACAPGRASSDGLKCSECASGTFAEGSGSIACSECEAVYGAAYTSGKGSSSCDTCVRDHYQHPEDSAQNGTHTCRPCPDGASCSEGTTLATLTIDRGFFRFSNTSTTLYLCPWGKAACPGNLGSFGRTICAEGFDGPLVSHVVHGVE